MPIGTISIKYLKKGFSIREMKNTGKFIMDLVHNCHPPSCLEQKTDPHGPLIAAKNFGHENPSQNKRNYDFKIQFPTIISTLFYY